MSELVLKVLVSGVILVVAFGSLRWLWTRQVDTHATLSRLFDRATETHWVVTRDPNKLYQRGNPVADVIGPVEELDAGILFRKLANTERFRRGARFEYRRHAYRVRRVGSVIARDGVVDPSGTTAFDNVLENVVCERIE